ncbi:MAG: hypothetical protein Q9180_007354, partial [Flavoplaca navasiana]
VDNSDMAHPAKCSQPLTYLTAPVIYELIKSDMVDFFFNNGSIECPPAVGVAEQYDGPYYRFLDNDGPNARELAHSARSMSRTAVSPDDFAREWLRRGVTLTPAAHACDLLEQQIE